MAKNIYGLDIGTSNIKIYHKDKDTFLNEKNIIAIANKTEVLHLVMKLLKCTKKHLIISRYLFRLNVV